MKHFTAHTINCVCHSIRSMFRVLAIYNFGLSITQSDMIKDCEIDYSSLRMSSRKLQNNHSIIPIKQS